MTMEVLPGLDALVLRALEEDLGTAGDITSAACIPAAARSEGDIVAREAGTVAGLVVAARVFSTVDAEVELVGRCDDGARVEAGTVLARVEGLARSLLAAERVALNLLGRLSGIATATADLVDRVAGTAARIADTRKTTPTLRALEKYAVRMGGGVNHRFGLHDAVMIKDNHIVAAGGIRPAVEAARRSIGHTVKIEVEADTLPQVQEALAAGADIVLLDNMDPATMARAVELVAGRMVVEASGGITPETVRAVADAGVDVISAGYLTHSAPALDVALDLHSS